MDPQIPLDQLRELTGIVLAAHAESTNEHWTVSSIELEFAERFKVLDEWLGNGGFSPWQHAH